MCSSVDGPHFLQYSAHFDLFAGQFDTFVQLPICKRCAIHFNVIMLSRLNGNTIFTVFNARLRLRW